MRGTTGKVRDDTGSGPPTQKQPPGTPGAKRNGQTASSLIGQATR
jgi:hypothetical protein